MAPVLNTHCHQPRPPHHSTPNLEKGFLLLFGFLTNISKRKLIWEEMCFSSFIDKYTQIVKNLEQIRNKMCVKSWGYGYHRLLNAQSMIISVKIYQCPTINSCEVNYVDWVRGRQVNPTLSSMKVRIGQNISCNQEEIYILTYSRCFWYLPNE